MNVSVEIIHVLVYTFSVEQDSPKCMCWRIWHMTGIKRNDRAGEARDSIKKDYYRMTGLRYSLGISTAVRYISQPQLRYMWWWRRYQERPGLFVRLILLTFSHRYGLEISPAAKIGKGLYLGHPYNITVGGEAVIGKNVNLHKGCTIGRENRGKRNGSPTIGDNVSVGINAAIVGAVHVGSDVMIAPNSFVNFDVPDHSVVIGNPGVIHHKENATAGYVGFQV